MIKKHQSRLLNYLLLSILIVITWGMLQVTAATTRVECENMTIGGTYAGKITSPFSGVALYANNDYCATNFNFATSTNTIAVRGCSNNSNTAQVAVLVAGTQVGTLSFTGTTPAIKSLSNVNTGTGSKELRLTVKTDIGTWDAYVDYLEITDSGSSPTPTKTPTPTPGITPTVTPTSSAQSGLPVPPGSNTVPRPTGAQGNLSVVNWAGFTGAGSYTFDDNTASQIANFSTLMSLNVRMTFYIASSWSGSTNNCWATAVSTGCELGNHSATHPQTANASDVDACTTFLQQHFGVTPLTAASPYGDSSYISVAQSRFLVNRGVNGGTILPNDNTAPYNLLCNIPAQGASASAMVTPFTNARNAGGWCILLLHGFTGYSDGAYQPVDISQFVSSVNTVKGYGDMWLDTLLNIGAYWRAQKMFSSITPTQSGSDLIYSWTLPAHFPTGKYLRIRVTGGTVKQNNQVINWDGHGYYEISLDAGALTVSP